MMELSYFNGVGLTMPTIEQPTETTCGPTVLHAVLDYLGATPVPPLETIIAQSQKLANGGTIAEVLGVQALQLGNYTARLHTTNLALYNPGWHYTDSGSLIRKLRFQAEIPGQSENRQFCSNAAADFLVAGGEIDYGEISPELLLSYIHKQIPIIAAVSYTHLYLADREDNMSGEPDEFGDSCGHFVIVTGYDSLQQTVTISDPFRPRLGHDKSTITVPWNRFLTAYTLGVLTNDASLLMIQPKTS